ncbi:MAG: hypothetical protein R3F17_02200 [Planctomycetota bacterium]
MNPLPEDARIALEAAKARRFSYSVRVLSAPDSRPVVILGETHVKLQRAAELGRRVVAAFPLRGVEGFQRKRVALGRTLGVLIEAPRLVLRAITGGLVQGSTIVEARALQTGVTFPLESTSPIPRGLHVGSIYLALYFGTFFLAMFSQLLPGPLRDLRRALVPLAISSTRISSRCPSPSPCGGIHGVG